MKRNGTVILRWKDMARDEDGYRLRFRAAKTGAYWIRVTAFPDTPNATYRLVWEEQ